MALGVLYVASGIELNLTEPDLGHPSMPGLWDRLYKHCPDGTLQCLECREQEPECPEWMYLQIRPNGQRVAVHHNRGIRDHREGDSDARKALKERIANAAVAGGFEAIIDDRSLGGRRRTGVLVRGSATMLGCEAQFSPIGASTVKRRSAVAAADGITPLWTTTDRTAQVIDRAPWARIDRLPWNRYLDDTKLPVHGGFRRLRREQCSRIGWVCPDRKAGRRCPGWHVLWDPEQVGRFDDLIVGAAGGEFVAVKQRISRQRAYYFWAPAADVAEVEPPEPTDFETDDLDRIVKMVDVTPRPVDRACHYGEETGIRGAPAPVRDDGDPVLARARTATAHPMPALVLDWTAPSHWASVALPCRHCGQTTQLRDEQNRPSHKVCAEAETPR
jgi:hypothetical protein